ncbi:unnamed protein product [Protopolystoma xenopodis]|uniref:Uncharacterized protein n=1 Tax=Protopolystoma xenopodis TaxID=117903 RepID=A0A448X9H1_9PLAT|nr:unnamed protein product [Protopolystoma xenopodis]
MAVKVAQLPPRVTPKSGMSERHCSNALHQRTCTLYMRSFFRIIIWFSRPSLDLI